MEQSRAPSNNNNDNNGSSGDDDEDEFFYYFLINLFINTNTQVTSSREQNCVNRTERLNSTYKVITALKTILRWRTNNNVLVSARTSALNCPLINNA